MFSQLCSGQINVLNIAPPRKVTVKAGGTGDGKLTFQLLSGYHVNSNTPSDQYLIPLRLTWNPGTLEATGVVYPQPGIQKFAFFEKPLSIFSGEVSLLSHFKAAASVTPGLNVITGKLRYQACNDRMCLTPKTIDVTLPVEIVR